MKLILTLLTSTLIIPLFQQSYREITLPSAAYGPTMDVAACDVDKDGDMDIILALEFQPNIILINHGNGKFINETDDRFPVQTRDSEDIAIADFDQDGDMDIVFASEDDIKMNPNQVVHEYYINDGKGKFSLSSFHLPNSEANAVAAVDLNADGYPDLVFGNAGQDFILINDKKGGFINETTTRFPKLDDVTQDVKLADIDKDGDLDIFLGNEDENKLLINDGKGFFTDESALRLPKGLSLETRKVEFGDADGDGDLDIFLSNVAWRPGKDAQPRLFINNGKGVFTDQTETRLPALKEFTLDGIFSDVDGDGDLDIVSISFGPSAGNAKIYENDGKGIFRFMKNPFAEDLKGGGIAVLEADFNNDKKKDYYFGYRGMRNRLFFGN